MPQQQQLASRSWYPALSLFLGFFLVYLAFSPLDLLGMGYVPRFFAVGSAMVNNLRHLLGASGSFEAVGTTSHGLIEPVLDIPFLWLGRLFGGPFDRPGGGPDILLSVEPVIEVALLCVLIFLWVRKLSTPMWAYLLAIAAAFTTMLWPYAYISLETTQSLCLMLAGYLVLGCDGRGRWRTVAVALASALACSVKTSGLFLTPAVAYLVYEYGRNERSRVSARTVVVAGACAVTFIFNHQAAMRSGAYTTQWHGSAGLFAVSHTTPIMSVLNVFNLFLSLNKGLLIYCPILVLALANLGRAWAKDRRVVVFALVALTCNVLALASLFAWADEVWGPRYLCANVAPLMVCLGAAKGAESFRWRREWAIVPLMIWGFAVSALGALFYYHDLHIVAIQAQAVTLEDLLHQMEWNPIRFDSELLRLWLDKEVLNKTVDQPWPPKGHLWPERIPRAITPVDLAPYAHPQGFVFHARERWRTWRGRIEWGVCFAAFPIGVALLLRTGRGLFALETVQRQSSAEIAA